MITILKPWRYRPARDQRIYVNVPSDPYNSLKNKNIIPLETGAVWRKQLSTGCRNLTKPLAVEVGSESARELRQIVPAAG